MQKLTEQPYSRQLKCRCRSGSLTAAVLPEWLDRAANQELSYADFLHGVLEEESVACASEGLRPSQHRPFRRL